ncbi:phage tail tip lysozyme, partial [Burkholderia cenocepacia]
KESNTQLTLMEKHWKHVDKYVSNVNKSIRESATQVSKMLGAVGMVGGMAAGFVGIPALMFAGYSKLMQGFGADRVTNLQMGGISQGSRAAFQNTYGRYGFGDNQLRAVAEAQRDPSKRPELIGALRAAGIGEQEAAQLSEPGVDAGEVMSRLINGIRTANPLTMRTMGGQFATPEQITTVTSALPGEIEGQRAEYMRQRPGLDAQDDDQRKALEFTSHLSEQFEKIRTAVFNKLIALEPSLDKVTKAFGSLVTDVLDSAGFKRFLSELPARINKFSEFLSSSKFTSSVTQFSDGVSRMGIVALKVADNLDKIANFFNDPIGFLNNDNKRKRNASQIETYEAELKADERYESGKMEPWEKVGYEASHAPDVLMGRKRSEKTRETLRDLYAERDQLNAIANPMGDGGNTINLNSAGMKGVSYVNPDGTARGPATTDEKAQFIGEFIAEGRRRGMKPEVIAGVLGSIAQESQFDPFVRNSVGAYGTSQWLNKDRQQSLEKFRKRNAGQSEMWVQARFAWQEMHDMNRLKGLNETGSMEGAAVYHRKYVEMPGEAEANDAARIKYGRQALNSYGDTLRGSLTATGGVSVNVVVQNQTGANVTANAAAAATH